jgi:hypothetical protein
MANKPRIEAQPDGNFKISTDSEGERATSSVVTREEFEEMVTSLGYTISVPPDSV